MKTKHRKGRKVIKTKWTNNFAYAIGLLAADGNLSPDGRHINFTSKDEALAVLYKKILCLSNSIGKKSRGAEKEKKYFVVQFGSVQFYDFLLSIGLTPAKSKTIQSIAVPDEFFWDFLRGCFDGDGNINEYIHPESVHAQLRVRFISASKEFLEWHMRTIRRLGKLSGGWIRTTPKKSVSVLSFGKQDSIIILNAMYSSSYGSFLKRKYHVAKKYLVQYSC